MYLFLSGPEVLLMGLLPSFYTLCVSKFSTNSPGS